MFEVFYIIDATSEVEAQFDAWCRLRKAYPDIKFQTCDVKRIYQRKGSQLIRYHVTFTDQENEHEHSS